MDSIEDLFVPHAPKVYTMPAGANFLHHLAQGLRASLGDQLSTALVLLPTRRAIRDLTNAFLDTAGGKATLLPLMRTLGDIDENEPPFEPGEIALQVPPSIHATRRKFELAGIVAHKMAKDGIEPDAASALAMTDPLLSLVNDLSMEELGVEALAKLDDKLAYLPEHFQDAAAFTKIVSLFWPQHLDALNLIEPMARRVKLLDLAAQLWREKPPVHPVIIAGSTGTLPATARLIREVASFDKGLVILPALDTRIDDKSFEQIDDQHPQASLKILLKTLRLKRDDIPDWPGVDLRTAAEMRERIISEAMIPAEASSDWPARIARLRKRYTGEDPIRDGLKGLSLIETKTDEEEASVISVIMRETLERPDKTSALVTPDPSLARRVRARLSRWGVEVDSSAGEPLEETLHGGFLSLCLDAALDPFDPITLSSLVKHRLFAFDPDGRVHWDVLEKAALRGPRAHSFDDLQSRLENARNTVDASEGLEFLKRIYSVLQPFHEALLNQDDAVALATAHTQTVETLAGGADQIWRDEAGEKAQGMMEELIAFGDLLPDVDGQVYKRLLSSMMRGRVVRPRYGTVENLQILGPLEARMLEADTIILGGLNEGVWPAHPAPHPILSRGMRKAIGLTAPERRFGLAAHDFAVLAAKPNAILTRAARTADGPAVMSRWLWRLKTLTQGALGDETDAILKPDQPYLDWARALDAAPETPKPAVRPEPRPPVTARWPKQRQGRRISVTQVQTWIRDPYAIYAQRVLGLSSTDPLDQPLGPREYGNAIHRSFERYAKEGDDKSAEWLTRVLKEELASTGYLPHTFSRNNVRLSEMADWFVEWRRTRRAQGWELSGAETRGKMPIVTEGEDFELVGIADRIEKAGDGFAVLDYKTGQVSTIAMVDAGFDPQLPLLAAMLKANAFNKSGIATELKYVKPNGRDMAKREVSIVGKTKTPEEHSVIAIELLKSLITDFDKPDTPYYSQPRAQYTNPYGDFDHLARRAEWAKLGKETGEPT